MCRKRPVPREGAPERTLSSERTRSVGMQSSGGGQNTRGRRPNYILGPARPSSPRHIGAGRHGRDAARSAADRVHCRLRRRRASPSARAHAPTWRRHCCRTARTKSESELVVLSSSTSACRPSTMGTHSRTAAAPRWGSRAAARTRAARVVLAMRAARGARRAGGRAHLSTGRRRR
jgi:hypothetical protein